MSIGPARRPVAMLVRVLALVLAACVLTQCGSSNSAGGHDVGTGGDGNSGAGTVAAASLPSQARDTLARIDAGGPFPYSQDGVVFENREGLLPDEKRGYYHEYTVVTPGSGDRGARRIITGSAGEQYYTDDHYSSFERIT